MNNNINIDELLKQSFLDLDPNNPANDHLFDMASQNAYNTNWPDANQVKKANNGSSSIFSSWKFYLSTIGAAGLISIATYYATKHNEKKPEAVKNSTHETNSLLVTKKFTSNNLDNVKNLSIVGSENIQSAKAPRYFTVEKVVIPKTKNQENKIIIESEIAKFETEVNSEEKNLVEEQPVVQYFSERERSLINDQINQLVIRLTSKLSEEFPMIPGAAGSSNGKTFQVAFYMWPTEITVSEYELFLNDLLMNGKKEEFDKYRPNLNNGFGSNLSDEDVNFFQKYFTDPTYSKHPVVFISPEGAQAYCNWLQELMNETSYGKNKNAIVRLPSKWEWERAAAGGKEQVFYGTSSGELNSGFMHHTPEANYGEYQANTFAFVGPKHGKKDKHSDKFFNFTTPVKSFKSNPYGLYDMSGNVSEMAVDVNGKIIAKGGSWNSSQEFLRIRDDDFNEFPKGAYACPFIGFRPIVNFK